MIGCVHVKLVDGEPADPATTDKLMSIVKSWIRRDPESLYHAEVAALFEHVLAPPDTSEPTSLVRQAALGELIQAASFSISVSTRELVTNDVGDDDPEVVPRTLEAIDNLAELVKRNFCQRPDVP